MGPVHGRNLHRSRCVHCPLCPVVGGGEGRAIFSSMFLTSRRLILSRFDRLVVTGCVQGFRGILFIPAVRPSLLSIRLSPTACLSLCLFLSLRSPVCLRAYLPVCLSGRQSLGPSVRLSVCLSVCLLYMHGCPHVCFRLPSGA